MHDDALLDIAQFMSRYAEALDQRDLEAWRGFFGTEAGYTVASFENQASGLPLLFINDDSRSKIDDRVRLVRDFWQGSFNDYLQRHILSFPIILHTAGEILRLAQSFSVYATETDLGSENSGSSSLMCVGAYRATTLGRGTERRFSRLEVVLDTAALPRSLVYPI